jgi:putative chitinase
MLLSELYDDQLQEGPMWDKIRKYGTGAAVGAGLAGAATMGLGNKTADAPQAPTSAPAAITQPAEPDSIPAHMFNPDDAKPAKPVASTALRVNADRQSFIFKKAVEAGLRGDELAAFMAQSAHETLGFNKMGEMGGRQYLQKQYDPKHNRAKAAELGNKKTGSGARFAGAGYMMLTGEYNYTEAGKALGLDLIKNPELMQRPEVAAATALWFWKTRVRPNVSDWDDVASVTRKINKGLAGLEDRQANYDLYRKKLSQKK